MTLGSLIKITITVSLMLMVVALGMRYEAGERGYLLRRPSLLVRSLAAMYFVTPLVIWGLITRLNLKAPVAIALGALAVSPVPPILPGRRLNMTSRAYVYGLVATAALFAVVLVPAVTALVGARLRIPYISLVEVLLLVVQTVVAPLVIGLIVQRLFPARAEQLATLASKTGTALLILALLAVLPVELAVLPLLLGDRTLVAILVFTFVGLIAGHLLGGPDPEHRTVLAVATASRHPGVALAIAGASFPTQKLVTAAIMLALVVSIIATVPYVAWRRRVHARAALETRLTEKGA
jgi:BASS family bile acid:Na+ symporter